MVRYKQLRDFIRVHGHCNLDIHKHRSLYSWMMNQRVLHKKGALSSDRYCRRV